MAVACTGTPTAPSISAARIARLSRTRFVAFGDSITSGEVTAPIGISGGVGRHVVIPSVSYPSVLLADLQAAYPAQAGEISMTNQGKGAENIVDGVLRFEDALASSGANVVLIQEGINSIGYPGIDVATELTRDMVWQSKQRGVAVFVGSMLPTVAGRQRSQDLAALGAYNGLLKAMCVQEKVTFVDLYAGLLPQAETLIGIDGLHPTEAGYRRIAEIFFAAIKSELEER
jgi:lysophospholipase L1-like esterase